MNNCQLAQLVEANEHLVRAVLQAHAQRALDEKKIRDITRSAELDVLTHLPNRITLLDRVSHAIFNAKRGGDRLALLFIDLNKFKHINDTLGHAAGDQILQTAARCMTNSVRESDTVSRYGGDEFVILLEKISELSDITSVVEKIFSALGASHQAGAHTIRLSASVGISVYPNDGNDVETLLTRADSAMYVAKRSGNAKFVFAGEGKTELPDHVSAPQEPPVKITRAEAEHRRVHRRTTDGQMASVTLAAQELQAGAELALRRQTEFMATLAHELRNPLGTIRNAASLIEKAPFIPAMAVKIHDVLDRQVLHMTKLLDDVFDMARIATGKMCVERERVDLVQAIQRAVEGAQSSINSRRQKLHCVLPDFPVEILGDAVRLVQIFANLLDNASKYTPEEGSIALTLEINETSVVVAVTDTGIGIPVEALPRVFDLFVQDTDATRFSGKGLGIGLALVKDLVEAHYGAVTAHSNGIGLGSQFTVTLPREADASASSV